MPPAAVALLRAAHEDARRAHGGTRYAARLAAHALADAGWHIAPTAPAHAPQRPA